MGRMMKVALGSIVLTCMAVQGAALVGLWLHWTVTGALRGDTAFSDGLMGACVFVGVFVGAFAPFFLYAALKPEPS